MYMLCARGCEVCSLREQKIIWFYTVLSRFQFIEYILFYYEKDDVI